MGWFEDIDRALPPIRLQDYRNESDFYGASDEIAKKLGLAEPPVPWAVWSHGWNYFPPRFPGCYTWDVQMEREVILVNREDEKLFLQDAGYPATFAVGASFLYAAQVSGPRLKNSLLIMPAHSLDYTRAEVDEGAYFAALDPCFSAFEHVAACVHPSCIRKGQWVEALDRRGIPYFTGVEIRDRNGLSRIRSILSAFSHVSSNWLGSHVPYAAHCGCSVSIFGPRPHMAREDFRDDPFYQQNPDMLEWFFGLLEAGSFEREFAPFFRRPEVTSDDRDWAAVQLGESNKRSPGEIARLFHWTADLSASSPDFAAWAPQYGWKPTVEGQAIELHRRVRELEQSVASTRERAEELEARLLDSYREAEKWLRIKDELIQNKDGWFLEAEELLRNKAQTIEKLRAVLARKNQTLAALREKSGLPRESSGPPEK